ncbi:DNA repair protein RecN [Phyllobacterium sp. 21LDTY02-6]|uniref:DNA repair protein RecN n=1 Tax=unclassified Phyllobacterium TaxID=2638441 RepID=UPI0020220650|nr:MULTISPECIES: DNA repair protein RecN [unclassified Phyllobacterium]MCO4315985.1 DNA repair protein RecN [Phyllobacterium sp. 21LDTY02-6]MCX8279591.1 DNA repair protein RecN [Phyllobacterium sp. 0TCS1.6C]MCX8292218.1 DNA repair protein RecN [Phyllobacterium sp. 0TCS1.6A]
MLSHLSIRDIVLIERLDIEFHEGLSVLTGETGAGKSILLDALSLALGARGDASLVRHGAEQGQVTASFNVALGHPARQLLRDNDIDDDGDIILRRMQSSDGRSRVFINDQAASVGLLRELGRKLVEIHGQHDDRALVDTGIHRTLLDAFGALDGAAAHVRALHKSWKDTEQALARHRARVEAAMREADYLRASVEELSKLDPEPQEEELLANKRSDMMRSEKIASDVNDANDVLSGNASPVPSLASLVRRLERKVPEAPHLLEPVVKSIDEALNALAEAQSGIEQAIRAIDFDPRVLEQTEERLFALRGAARKYSVTVDDLPALRDRMDADLADLDAGAERLAKLEADAAAARDSYDEAARKLSEQRRETADHLKQAVMAELPALKLERAEFIVEMTTDGDNRMPEGIDTVEYWVRTNPGTRAGPMMKVASGGELSRFLLALKVALADRGSAPTLVFDEIDTGVGGAVADAIGQRLRRLASTVQVLSVTHAPQVAARAQTHFLIAKAAAGNDRVATSIRAMAIDDRQEEIARMLAGASVTEEARAAAVRLLRENAAIVS